MTWMKRANCLGSPVGAVVLSFHALYLRHIQLLGDDRWRTTRASPDKLSLIIQWATDLKLPAITKSKVVGVAQVGSRVDLV